MLKSIPWKTILGLWMCWAVLTVAYQGLVKMRIGDLQRPDRALEWTQTCTFKDSQDHQPYLMDPFMNEQVCWDSEFYLSISAVGYDDPLVRSTPVKNGATSRLSLNYAFFPVYPLFMRLFYFPLRWLGWNSIPAATLAGVAVSLLGTPLALLGLYDLVRHMGEDEDTAIRVIWYLLIFPAGFFLAMVYSEGLFTGLVFMALALLRRRQWVWAGLLAALATLTRPVGGLIILPLAWAWWQDKTPEMLKQTGRIRWRAILSTWMVLLPGLVILAWKFSDWGGAFESVEQTFFGRKLLDIAVSMQNWEHAWQSMWGGSPATTVFYGLEFGALALAVCASIWLWRREPSLAVYGLLLILVAFFSAVPQGLPRYVLPVPAIYIMLARLGKNPVFERAWSMASLLLFALQALLFAFDFWVG
ncbi:MAG: glycosyltransferase 87 family protein [Anaerolineae bacterium]|nr:glycosyltransferase 87 family protein [Anaerolineae bacterium]